MEYENALVLVTDMKIENVKDIIPLLEQVGARPRERGISRGGGGVVCRGVLLMLRSLPSSSPQVPRRSRQAGAAAAAAAAAHATRTAA